MSQPCTLHQNLSCFTLPNTCHPLQTQTKSPPPPLHPPPPTSYRSSSKDSEYQNSFPSPGSLLTFKKKKKKFRRWSACNISQPKLVLNLFTITPSLTRLLLQCFIGIHGLCLYLNCGGGEHSLWAVAELLRRGWGGCCQDDSRRAGQCCWCVRRGHGCQQGVIVRQLSLDAVGLRGSGCSMDELGLLGQIKGAAMSVEDGRVRLWAAKKQRKVSCLCYGKRKVTVVMSYETGWQCCYNHTCHSPALTPENKNLYMGHQVSTGLPCFCHTNMLHSKEWTSLVKTQQNTLWLSPWIPVLSLKHTAQQGKIILYLYQHFHM